MASAVPSHPLQHGKGAVVSAPRLMGQNSQRVATGGFQTASSHVDCASNDHITQCRYFPLVSYHISSARLLPRLSLSLKHPVPPPHPQSLH